MPLTQQIIRQVVKEEIKDAFKPIGNKFEQVDKRFDEVDQRFDRLEAKIDRLSNLVTDFAGEIKTSQEERLFMGEQIGRLNKAVFKAAT